jgi:hypothetical protein
MYDEGASILLTIGNLRPLVKFPGKLGALLGAIVVAAGYAVYVAATPQPAESDAAAKLCPAAGVSKPNSSPLGMASCASQACHGRDSHGVGGAPAWESSFLVWQNHDRHTQAFRVLHHERSKQIIRQLANGNAKAAKELQWTKPAYEEERCLACHTNPALACTTEPAKIALRSEGVSCEACHGNAEGWRSEHHQWDSSIDRDSRYPLLGLTKLYDLGVRAEVCSGCHVGALAADGVPKRDVNHDLIAAGHPRLNFEFAAYSRWMPRHWDEKFRTETSARLVDRNKGDKRPPGLEAQLWLIGQAASAEASLKLLADRAGPNGTWPELAEYNCAGCHHALGTGFRENSTGSLAWNRPVLWEPNAQDPALKQIGALGKLLEADKHAIGEKDKIWKVGVSEEATIAARIWHDRRLEFEKGKPGEMIKEFDNVPRPPGFEDRLEWADAFRHYAALYAEENARRELGKGRPGMDECLSGWHDRLRAPGVGISSVLDNLPRMPR